MRPRSSVQSVLLNNSMDSDGNYIPMRIEINSWVNLMPGKIGGHAKDAAKHGSATIGGSYKAKVLDFRVSSGMKTISAVQVQHAYMRRQLNLDPRIQVQNAACNYLYLSEFKDWVHPQSLLGVIVVMHAEIGELTRGNRSHSELLMDSGFFYNAFYIPRRGAGGFGRLESIPLPSFDSPEWPLPDMSTTESFRAKLRQDFHSSMRPTTGSKQTHLSWFMPIGVFVDLFFIGDMHRTKFMFIYKHASDELCRSLMDSGWDSKVTIGTDVLKTTITKDSVKFRYHISRSMLYANFVYNRHKMLPDSTWEALDQYDHVQTVLLNCEMGGFHEELEVGISWTIHEVRQEISIHFGAALNSPDFDIWIVSGDIANKVNVRNEKNVTVQLCLPPNKLRVILRC